MPLIFGTWKLDPKYGRVRSITAAAQLIDYALNNKIRSFDTASVYANQEIEKILGNYSKEKLDIVSKIPAIQKVSFWEERNAFELYPEEWVKRIVNQTTSNLDRTDYTMLLHNFGVWSNLDKVIIFLNQMRDEGYISKIGISLPNNFRGSIPNEIINLIDVVETPYNIENKWIERNYKTLENKRILLRSLLKNLDTTCDETDSEIKVIMNAAYSYSNDLIIGMTNFEQVDRNIRQFNGLK